MKTLLSIALGIVLTTAFPATNAHHNGSACVARDKSITVTGTVLEYLFTDPHSALVILADDGEVITAEWMTMQQLRSVWRIDAATLHKGDRLVLTGSPYECESNRMSLLTSVTRPADGWSWSVKRDARGEPIPASGN